MSQLGQKFGNVSELVLKSLDSWTETFLRHGGYHGLLCRLDEILSLEWRSVFGFRSNIILTRTFREEQHDDKCLHEILRCIKALSTSAAGCQGLRDGGTSPFKQLIQLLYSEKKPGELATRQLIVELLIALFDLYTDYPQHVIPRLASDRSTEPPTLFSFARSLLLTPAPPPIEQASAPVKPHEFIESIHVPRIYKAYLQELSDICRDYFWVFCHSNNPVWFLSRTDEAKVERPKAPGGMTGGVEFEAMQYLVRFDLL